MHYYIPINGSASTRSHVDFLAASFFFSFSACLIMTELTKVPTTPKAMTSRITGIRMAHTRGGKNCCRKCDSSTKG